MIFWGVFGLTLHIFEFFIFDLFLYFPTNFIHHISKISLYLLLSPLKLGMLVLILNFWSSKLVKTIHVKLIKIANIPVEQKTESYCAWNKSEEPYWQTGKRLQLQRHCLQDSNEWFTKIPMTKSFQTSTSSMSKVLIKNPELFCLGFYYCFDAIRDQRKSVCWVLIWLLLIYGVSKNQENQTLSINLSCITLVGLFTNFCQHSQSQNLYSAFEGIL